jgi:hypothetical protein
MSHRHSAQLQLYSNTEASEISSLEVARAFVLAYRVLAMEVIIAGNGNNSYLAHGIPHCNVRRHFADTTTGISAKLANLL